MERRNERESRIWAYLYSERVKDFLNDIQRDR
jgi:hypothetical protein